MSDTLISDKVEKSNDKSRAKEDGGKVAERRFDYFYSFSIISQKSVHQILSLAWHKTIVSMTVQWTWSLKAAL